MDPLSGTRERSYKRVIDYGVAQIPLAGQTVNGDCYLVSPFPGGIFVAVVDGLGHGKEAAEAGEVAIATMQEHLPEPLIPLLKRCDEALRRTRGAAISLASFGAAHHSMTWLGVGNVEGVVLRADRNAVPAQEQIMLFPGTVGHQLPPLRAVVTALNTGDLVIFFTDGIRRDFLVEPLPTCSPQLIANRICDEHRKGTDDALVLVVRYTGVAR